MTELIEHLKRLVRIPSVSRMSNRPVTDYAAEVLRGNGWTTREITYLDPAGVEKVNLIAAPADQSVQAHAVDLAFVCHTDTIPFDTGWEQALQPYVEDGVLHGCGACDVKGILACLLSAAGASQGRYIDGLRIVLTADEEVGCVGASRLAGMAQLQAKRMVVGEPTSLRVARAGKGYCLARLSFAGREAHSAHPSQGASAILAAARMIVALEELAARLMQERNELFEPQYTTLNVGTIEGGTAKNIVPGKCEFLVEWRPVPVKAGARTAAQTDVLQQIEALAHAATSADPRVACRIDVLRQQAGFETAADASLVQSIVGLTGRLPTSIPFASEASVFAGIADEIVVFGPGDMRTAHSERECVPLLELEQAYGVMCSLMSRA